MISFKALLELHAPKGGLRVQFKQYKGGEFIPTTKPQAWAMLKTADASLPDEAAEAIDKFIGMRHDVMDHPDDTQYGFMVARPLERAYGKEFEKDSWDADGSRYAEEKEKAALVRKQLDAAFAPVRATLKKEIGPFITLYRGQSPVNKKIETSGFDPGERKLLSWTSDPEVAKSFVGMRRVHRVPSIEEIDKAVDDFAQDGIAHIPFKGWWIKLNSEMPQYYDIFACREKEEMGDHSYVTDGDVKDLRNELMDYRKERLDDKAEEDAKLSKITMGRIPLDAVVWISNRAGQKEFIVKNIPGTPWYIDDSGTRLKSFRSFTTSSKNRT